MASTAVGEAGHKDGAETSFSGAPASRPQSAGSLPSTTEVDEKSTSLRRRVWNKISWFIFDQWFLIILGILIAISSQAPLPQSKQGTKVTVINYLCVTIIFFINGCTISTRTLLANLLRWRAHAFVQGLSYLMCSAVVFAIVSAAATNESFMDPGLLMGMIVLGCLPNTIAFGVTMTKQAHGNAALTVAQSTIGNFLGPFLAPALVNMYISAGGYYTAILPSNTGSYTEIYRRVFMQLGLTVFVPVFVGQVVQALLPKLCQKVMSEWHGAKVGSLALLVIIWSTFDSAFSSGAWGTIPASNVVFLIFTCIGFFFVWFLLTFVGSMLWMPRVDVAAVVYCVPTKTPAMGVPLTHVMFLGLAPIVESKLQIPIVVYQGFQVALSSLSTIPLRKWVDRGAMVEAEQEQDGEAKGDSSKDEEIPG